jgi:hypothetical protein
LRRKEERERAKEGSVKDVEGENEVGLETPWLTRWE